MLRTLLISTALLAASGTALAHDEVYGRVITVEPHFSVSFGTGYHDGFRVLYESGSSRYWTYTPQHPGHVVVLPPRVRHVHHHHYRDDHRWRDRRHDRHDDRHSGWRSDPRGEHRGDHRRPPGHRY
jgi:hypothetical protein